MRISELNLPIYDEDEELELPWDEVDSMYDPDQFQRKEENQIHPEEDESSMTTEPEDEDFATNGYRGLEWAKGNL